MTAAASVSAESLHCLIEDYTDPANPVFVQRIVEERGNVTPLHTGLMLPSNTTYRESVLHADTLNVAAFSFTMGDPGTESEDLGPLRFEPDPFPDTDGDGLGGLGEYVLGTHPEVWDTDGDGVSDGAEVQQGTNPLDGTIAQTGIIASLALPGTAADITAIDDLVAVAYHGTPNGVVVCNVFTAMNPVIVAQVGTLGAAHSLAVWEDFIAVADGGAGLVVLDIREPEFAHIAYRVESIVLGGEALSVATRAGVVFAGLNTGRVVAADLASGAILDRIDGFGGSEVRDIVVSGDRIYAASADAVHVLRFDAGDLSRTGSVATSNTGNLRLRAGDGIAWVTHKRGYDTIDISDLDSPSMVAATSEPVFWRDMAVTGTGPGALGASVSGPAGAQEGTAEFTNLVIYDVSDPARTNAATDPDTEISILATPGSPMSVDLYNGLAYVADGGGGLQVMNFRGNDIARIPPLILVDFNIPTEIVPRVEEGQLVRVTANVSDDYSVRNVEFHYDGEKVLTDGNFPYEHFFIAPSLADIESFRLKIRASDMSGNYSETGDIYVYLTPDATGPFVKSVFPANDALVSTDHFASVLALFSEPVDPATVVSSSFTLHDSAPAPVAAAYETRNSQTVAALTPTTTPAPGTYAAAVETTITDLAGNPLAARHEWTFTLFDPTVDTDGDCLPDSIEPLLGYDPNDSDSDDNSTDDGDEDFDGDGLTNCEEMQLAMDPRNPDTDGDGIVDSAEDTDGDGLLDLDELLTHGTSPFLVDTDGDRFGDYEEVTLVLPLGTSDPLDAGVMPLHLLGSGDWLPAIVENQGWNDTVLTTDGALVHNAGWNDTVLTTRGVSVEYP